MTSAWSFLLIVFLLCVGMLLALELGRLQGGRRRSRSKDETTVGLTAIDGAIFGLMGLLLAFTFSGAADRFEMHRHLVVDETNAIGTAYLRLDLLPAGARTDLQADFREYVDARLNFYGTLNDDPESAQAHLVHSQELQKEIWQKAVAACATVGSPATTQLVLTSLNTMIDLTTTRAVALETHPPLLIYIVLGILILISAFLAGYEMAGSRKSNWVHMVMYALVLAMTFYLILDLEFPRMGIIRVDRVDHILVELRRSMN